MCLLNCHHLIQEHSIMIVIDFEGLTLFSWNNNDVTHVQLNYTKNRQRKNQKVQKGWNMDNL